MGKPDKTQPKLTFTQTRSKSTESGEEDTNTPPTASNTDTDIKQMLIAMEARLQGGITELGTKMDALTYQMDRMGERLDKHAERLDMAERRLTEAEEAQTTINSDHERIGKVFRALQDKTEDLEARSRRCNIRLMGLPESTQTGAMEKFVESLLQRLLGEGVFSNLFMVERAHRSLGPRPPPGTTPRPIIAKRLNYRDRDAALRAAREKQPLIYKGSTISIYPDFTPKVQDARRQFAPMKKQLKEWGLDYAMLYPAKLRVNTQGRSFFFTDTKTLQKTMKEWAKARKKDLPKRLEDEASGGTLDDVE